MGRGLYPAGAFRLALPKLADQLEGGRLGRAALLVRLGLRLQPDTQGRTLLETHGNCDKADEVGAGLIWRYFKGSLWGWLFYLIILDQGTTGWL